MDEHRTATVKKKLESLRNNFLASLPDRCKEIETLFEGMDTSVYNVINDQKLHGILHTLSGSLGTFGLPGGGLLAKEAEEVLYSIIREKRGANRCRKECS